MVHADHPAERRRRFRAFGSGGWRSRGPIIGPERCDMTDAITVPRIHPQIVQLEARQTAVMRIEGQPPELPSLLREAFEATMRQIAESGGQVVGPPFARYLAFGERIEAEAGFPYLGTLVPTERVHHALFPATRAVMATHVGPYEEISTAWSQVQQWIGEQGLIPASAPWESYLTGPGDAGEPVTQIVFPVH
jgi:effector-binding domain-containing protein